MRGILGAVIGAAVGFGLSQVARCASGTCPLTGNPIVATLLFAAVGAFIASSGSSQKGAATRVRPQTSNLALISSEQEFETKVLQSSLPALVEFYAAWCGPCRRMAPIIEELAAAVQGKAVVAKLDVDNLRTVAERYEVQAVPTFILFRSGKAEKRLTGSQTKQKLLDALRLAAS